MVKTRLAAEGMARPQPKLPAQLLVSSVAIVRKLPSDLGAGERIRTAGLPVYKKYGPVLRAP